MDSNKTTGSRPGPQAMLSAFQEHNQTYFEYMNVRSANMNPDAIGLSPSS